MYIKTLIMSIGSVAGTLVTIASFSFTLFIYC